MSYRTQRTEHFNDIIVNDPAPDSSFSLIVRYYTNVDTFIDLWEIPTGRVNIWSVVATHLLYKNIPVHGEMKYTDKFIRKNGLIDDPLSLVRTDDYEHYRIMKRFNAAIKSMGKERFLTTFLRELRGYGGIKSSPLAAQINIDLEAAIKKREAFNALVESKAGWKTPYVVLDKVFEFL